MPTPLGNPAQSQDAQTSDIVHNPLSTAKPLLVAASGKKPMRTPLWLMRQAGRYLPEYRSLREKYDTLTMFTTPEIASEVTLQPLRRYDLDAAIVYADILLIPHALGLGLSFAAGEGPRFSKCIRLPSDVDWLEKQATNTAEIVNRCSYLAETLVSVKKQLAPHQTLIGFCGAPWTVASYMIEGGSAKGEFFESKMFMYKYPAAFEKLMKIITDVSIDYLKMQVEAGAEILQIFESWGGALTPLQYEKFCAPHTQRLAAALQNRVPMIHFVGESAGLLNPALQVSSQVFGVDWRQNLSHVSANPLAVNKCLQGNLDPLLLHAEKSVLRYEVEQVLQQGLNHPGGYIFNLGHGIKQTTPPEAIQTVVETVHNFRI